MCGCNRNHGDGSEKPQNEENPAEQPAASQEAPKQPERKPIPVTVTDIELEQLKAEAAEYKNKYLHLLADSENARKRLHKERLDISRYAVESTVIDFLTPLDHLENALKYADQMSNEIKHWAVGFQMILNQFKEALSNNGIAAFTSMGSQFDPHYHEAVEMVESSKHTPGTIIEENVRGYKMGDRVIRPARVKVAKAPAPVEQVNDETKENN